MGGGAGGMGGDAGGMGGSGGMGGGSGGMGGGMVIDPGPDFMAVIPGPGTGGTGGAGGLPGAGGANEMTSLPCEPIEPVRDKAILLDLDESDPIPALQDGAAKAQLMELLCGEPQVVAETAGNQVSVVATHLPWTKEPDDKNRLQNQHRYLVRVAALDQAGNFGKLSAPQCGVPYNVKGFGDAYAEAGGMAGCNCSIPRDEGDLAAFASGGLVAAAAMLVRRRSKKKTKTNRRHA